MNNITSISGYLQAESHASGNSVGPTSIEVNNLVYLGGLYISGVTPLKNVSFPDLNTTSDLELHFNSTDAEAHFPSLTNATNVLIYGPISKSYSQIKNWFGLADDSRLDFSSLTTVNRLTVSSNDTFSDPSYLNSYVYEDYSYPSSEISFPLLQSCTGLFFYGNISR